jgi:hypothetical protein
MVFFLTKAVIYNLPVNNIYTIWVKTQEAAVATGLLKFIWNTGGSN